LELLVKVYHALQNLPFRCIIKRGGRMTLSHEEKLELMRCLNWDYAAETQDMLAVVEGKLEKTGPFDRVFLFVRSLERLPWHCVIGLWGVETAKELYTPEAARRLWPKNMRCIYDFAFAILRREPVSLAEWGSPRSKELQHTFLSHRWNRAEQSVLPPPLF
jgi:hypothetical protein